MTSDSMRAEQLNDFKSILEELKGTQFTVERYEEKKARFLEATKDLEFLSGLLFYIEDEKLHSEAIVYDRKHYDEINSPFLKITKDRLTKEYVMELKERYNIKK